ncbi:MAG TPA: molybdopterin molybdenumtransferase MoeA [Oceanithermus profundus]|uniref:Molybdopterin molybdenumtransferase n=1 Tax=Oceanithermus profundus TaxID=187137 RepID=A0A7C4VD75_9DEIN|nr:molybdopterin molybdenumtransferase MoeA [Oceanithermus profundus]
MRTSLTVEEALATVLEHTRPIPDVEEVPLEEALGRVLARDLEALADHPDVDNTAVDGYAARAADTAGASPENPVRLRWIGESPAGRPFPGRLGPGEAVSVYTGAPLPEGADAVVAVEDTERDGEYVLLYKPASPKDIRPKAQDLKKGEVYLKRGDRLTPGRVGLAAGMGHRTLPVVRRPRVGVLSTGDEVVEPGTPLPPGGVYNSNAYSVAALVREAGGEPVLLGKVGDRVEEVKAQLEGAGDLDLVLTSGGVSMGDYDIVRHLLEREGKIHFWKILQRPGGPPIFAEFLGRPFFGLPGNPVSAMVTFFLYGRPMLFKMLGRSDPPYRRVRALAEGFFKGAGHKVAFRRAVLRYDPEAPGGHRAASVDSQSSGVLRSMAFGNALVVVPPHTHVEAGEVVEAIPFGEIG